MTTTVMPGMSRKKPWERFAGPHGEPMMFDVWLNQSEFQPLPDGFTTWNGAQNHWDQGHQLGWALYCFEQYFNYAKKKKCSSARDPKLLLTGGKLMIKEYKLQVGDQTTTAVRFDDIVLFEYNGATIEVPAAIKVNGFSSGRRDTNINNMSLRDLMKENVDYDYLFRPIRP